MDKKVSIILSTYNEALVIENTINEILKNLDNVEIILVDDNSPDGTFEKVKKNEQSKSKSIFKKNKRAWISLSVGTNKFIIRCCRMARFKHGKFSK